MTARQTARALVLVVVALLSIGLVLLASSSSVRATALFDDPNHFIKRQLLWLAIALPAAIAAARIDYHTWRRYAVPLVVLALLLLAAVYIPQVGVRIGGSRRWLALGPMRLQPSEFAKLAVIVGLAAWMCRIERHAMELRPGLVYPMAGLGVFALLIIAEPDFGTTLLIVAVGMIVMFAGGTSLSHLIVTGALGFSAFMLAILNDPVRRGRILAFLNPEDYPNVAYHLAQSKLAFIRGGPFGVGLGNSIQKQFYLPEAHTDFILAIIGEELGIFATLGVLLLFLCMLWAGLRISFAAPDSFGRLLGFGITFMVVLQAAINVGVVTGCLPTKGLPLPFISYGGSSLVAALAAVGILLNIAYQCPEDGDDPALSIKDRSHAF